MVTTSSRQLLARAPGSQPLGPADMNAALHPSLMAGKRRRPAAEYT